MGQKSKASQLYKQGRYNHASITVEADGTTTVTCDGRQAPRPYTFKARHLLTDREEVLEDQDVDVEDVATQPAAAVEE